MKITVLQLLVVALFLATGCRDNDIPEMPTVTVNGQVLFDNSGDFNGDIDADFRGIGGSVKKTFQWRNNLSTADYNADISARSGAIFNMVVKDADGNTVLDRLLHGASEQDSFSGVTSQGIKGTWSVTITLTSFNGNGSFSLSEGD